MEIQQDRPAYVRFEMRAVEDRNATIKNGYFTTRDVEFALITPPYSKDCIEREVAAWLEDNERNVRQNRIPREWADKWKSAYEAWKKGQELPLDGTPIKGWGVISPAHQANLLSMGVHTVEDLAKMNDEGCRRFGMGAVDMKNRAQAYLKAQNGPAKLAQENAALKAKVDQQEQQIKDLAAKMEELKAILPKKERMAA